MDNTSENLVPVVIRSVHRPELLPRRGEWISWSLTGLVGVTWIFLAWWGQGMNWVVTFLLVFLLLSALSITFGNWMDRKTVLQYDADHVQYENGLRHVDLRWADIQQVQVFPSKMGKKVHVLGQNAHFAFRTLGEVKIQNEVKGRMGFVEGEKILQHILIESGLIEMSQSDQGFYYVRK